MAGLLVHRAALSAALRHGSEWTRATRPLVLIFTGICFAVTLAFRAGVEAQAGAYATGVLALMTSATIAVTLSAWRRGERRAAFGIGLVSLIFIYTIVNVVERPEGLQIAGFFIGAIVVTSLVSRIFRSTELRGRVELDKTAQRFIEEAANREDAYYRQPTARRGRAGISSEREGAAGRQSHSAQRCCFWRSSLVILRSSRKCWRFGA